jgi:hypothetical protein
MAAIDTGKWSGDGDFTRVLVDLLGTFDEIASVRVEDSPASRADVGYAFLSNEIYVGFAARPEAHRATWLGVIPITRTRDVPAMSLAALAERLGATEGIGEPDYQDEGMLQFLRAERVKAPWQSKGIKVVELVRLYDLPHVCPPAPRPR